MERSKNTEKEVDIKINNSTFISIIGRERFEKFRQIKNVCVAKMRIS
jgi:hypothetical protein